MNVPGSFDLKWTPEPNSGCWLWTAALDSWGYGLVRIDGVLRKAHRVAFGEVPRGLELDHLCKVRCCVNPDHLEAVTCRENGHRSDSWSGKNFRKTHCPDGHEYSAENTLVSSGRRYCRMCAKKHAKKTMNKRSSP